MTTSQETEKTSIPARIPVEQTCTEQVLSQMAQDLLKQLQAAIELNKFGPLSDAQNSFMDFLRSLPLEYRSLRLTINFNEKDTKQQNLTQLKESLGVAPEGSTYDLLVLVPRRPPTDDIKAAHGSPVRERFFLSGK